MNAKTSCFALLSIVLIPLGALVPAHAGLPEAAPARPLEEALDPTAAAARQDWHARLEHTHPPGTGCFHVRYPSLVWERTACSQTKPTPPTLRTATARPAAVTPTGTDAKDYALKTDQLIQQAVGSFPVVRGVNTIRSGGKTSGPDEFSLQLDSNADTTTSACGNHPGCHVWQQFLYGMGGEEGSLFIQYWLINYGNICPSGWAGGGSGSCYTNSTVTQTPAIAATALGHLKLSARATLNGQDTAILANGSNAYSISAPDNVLKLASVWHGADFNVLGNGNGSQARFNPGSAVTVNLAVSNHSTAAPRCIGNGAVTGETNNLQVGSCTASGGTTPSIQFTEMN